MTSKPGGHSTPRPPSNDEIEFLTSGKVRDLLLSKITTTTTRATSGDEIIDDYKFVPILVTIQVVAGTVYQVKYKLVNNKDDSIIGYVHAKIFKPLPCYETQQNIDLMNFVNDDNCTADSPLQL